MAKSLAASREAGHAVTDSGVGTGPRRRVSRPMSAELYPRRSLPAESDIPPEPGSGQAPVAPEAERGDYPPDLVFIVDLAGQVLYVNRPLGALTEEDVIGSEICDWIFPEQHSLIRERLTKVRATCRPEGCEIPGIQHYDADAWYECRITPNLRDERIVSVTIIARDITRHKRAQQRMRTRLVELERVAEEREADVQRARQALEEQAASRAAESEDERTHRWFRALLDAAGEAIFVTDPETGEILDANETACRWLRRASEDVLGRTPADLGLEFPIAFPEDADLQFTETRDSRRPLMLNGGVHRRQDGSTFPVEVAVARHDIAGREVVLAVVRDVKGRQRLEDELHARDARYQALIDQSWDAIYVTTRAGAVTEANAAALELFAYSRDQLDGLDARALIPRPGDIRRWQRAMAEDGVVERLEAEFHRQDGTVFSGYLSASRLRDRDGQITGYQCLVRPADLVIGEPGTASAAASAAEERPASAEDSASGSTAGTEATVPDPGSQGESVLVVDSNQDRRNEIRDALEEAGYHVLTERDAGRAAEHFRDPDPALVAVVVGLEGQGAAGEWAARAIRALDDAVPLIAVIGNGRAADAAARLDDVGLAATLPAPLHPLALVQALRAARMPE